MTIRDDIITRLNEFKDMPKNKGRLTASSLARIISPSNPSSFNSRLSQFKKGNIVELPFCDYYLLCKHLFKDNYKTTFTDWCFQFQSYDNIVNAFEFASTNRLFELTNHLLKVVNSLDSKTDIVHELKEIAKIYKIVMLFQQRVKTNNEIRYLLRRFYPRYQIVQVLKTILECNMLYQELDFRSINRLIDDARITIKSLKRDFVKWSFKVRVFELLSQINLYAKNNTKKSRKYAKLVIKSDIGDKFIADSYHNIGMSYLFDDRERCLKYIDKYHQMVIETQRHALAKNIRDTDLAFVNNVWGIFSPTDDLSEQAHYESKWGDKNKAKTLIDEAIKKHGESAYKLLYKGLAYDDVQFFAEAFSLFLSGDNKFHARLVIKYVPDLFLKQQLEIMLKTYKVY